MPDLNYADLPPLIAFLFILFGLLVLAILHWDLRSTARLVGQLEDSTRRLNASQALLDTVHADLADAAAEVEVALADRQALNESLARHRERVQALEAELLRCDSHRRSTVAETAHLLAWVNTAHQFGLEAQREVGERWYGRNEGKAPLFLSQLVKHCAQSPERRAADPVPVSETGLGR